MLDKQPSCRVSCFQMGAALSSGEAKQMAQVIEIIQKLCIQGLCAELGVDLESHGLFEFARVQHARKIKQRSICGYKSWCRSGISGRQNAPDAYSINQQE